MGNWKPIKKRILGEWIIGWGFVLPFVALWIIWFAKPFFEAFQFSLYRFSFAYPDQTKYLGLQNYIDILHDHYFWIAFRHSFIFVLITVPALLVSSLPIAALLNGQFRGRGLFRTIFYTPYVVSSIAVTTVFMYFFIQGGLLSRLFHLFGLANVTWYTNINYALPFVIIIYIWQYTGFYVVIYLAGIQGISQELYEAAKVDGATSFQILMKITVPLLRPTIFFGTTLSLINAFQVFDQIAALCKNSVIGSPAGATSTLVTYFYSYSFNYYEMGYGSAAAVILFLFILCFTVINQIISNKMGEYST